MKKILIIATGGTIASMPTEDGLSPNISSEQFIAAVPEIENYCDITAVQYFNLDSTNMNHKHWLSLAEYIREQPAFLFFPLFPVLALNLQPHRAI